MRTRPSETSRILSLPLRGAHPGNARARLESLLSARPQVVQPHDKGWPGTAHAGKRERCDCSDGSCQHLLTVQAEALTEALVQSRVHPDRLVVGRIGVGGGKTLISLLLPSILPCKRPVLLVPAKLRSKTLRAMPEIKRHWRVRSDILLHSYEEVSVNPELLDELGADLVIGDEAHRLARLQAGRTRRVLRVAKRRPEIRWVWLSGTFDKRSPKDSAHLVELALRDGSYLPIDENELKSWHNVLGSRGVPEATDWGMFRPIVDAWGERPERWDESASARLQLCREALDKRVRATPGVVTLQTMSCDASVILRRVHRDCPQEIRSAIREMTDTGLIPGSSGAAALGDVEVTRASETLAMGFFYRWAWERTRKGEPDKDWMGARSFYSSELSDYLVIGGQGERDGVDTPGHVARIAESDPGRLPHGLVAAYQGWCLVRDRYRIAYLDDHPGGGEEVIPVEPVWLTADVVGWMVDELETPGTIVWYHHRAVARALQGLGARVFLRGQEPPNDGVSCCLSEHSHGEGHDLESFGRMVIPCPTPSGSHVEQLIGRIHRPGQQRDEVEVDLWTHVDRLDESVDRALVDARYLHYSGTLQRLIVGTWE